VNELGGRLQVEGLALFGEDKRSDGVDVLLFHALYAAHSGALHCCQLEFAEGLKGRQLEYFELLF